MTNYDLIENWIQNLFISSVFLATQCNVLATQHNVPLFGENFAAFPFDVTDKRTREEEREKEREEIENVILVFFHQIPSDKYKILSSVKLLLKMHTFKKEYF